MKRILRFEDDFTIAEMICAFLWRNKKQHFLLLEAMKVGKTNY